MKGFMQWNGWKDNRFQKVSNPVPALDHQTSVYQLSYRGSRLLGRCMSLDFWISWTSTKEKIGTDVGRPQVIDSCCLSVP